ncbi:acetyltransferase (GNAT) family protein [Oxobacter pfennigii]|uniref:Acetyltransferase (GNAT) family protein n=1 Tax=Oxobacter pfennigii TaxID=36849 RepID=A0A0P8YCE1_9CLOT|nr:GNAT family N-acetyltransferase [Oxobacter pfennigii]KPU44815.1 acetyltransferase (GNAT) family protein [Oxobacter pfennigii]
MDKSAVEIKMLRIADLHPDTLRKFNRYQITNRVKYMESGHYDYKDDHFIEHWDDNKKHQVIESLQRCIQTGGIAAGAFICCELIGFANIEKNFFGKNKEYLELPYIHVSYEYRSHGIGKRLFALCCDQAKKLGARKIYISSHPSEETQSFYKSVGCVLASEVNMEILNREPLDIQLEFVL